jgi:hypothetical protein
MIRRHRIAVALASSVLVATIGLAMFIELSSPSIGSLMRIRLSGREIDAACFVNDSECRKGAQTFDDQLRRGIEEDRRKNPKEQLPTFAILCIQADDPSLSKDWRTHFSIGTWYGGRVYYYYEPERLDLSGAFVRAVPPDDVGGESKAADIFVDRQTCEKRVADDKKDWRDSLDLQSSAAHDPKVKAEIAGLDQVFKEEKQNAFAACIPYKNATPIVEHFCDGGLPLKLQVSAGEATYECDYSILKPSSLAK